MAPPIIEAAKRGDLKAVCDLLDKRADIESKTSIGSTPLHWASANGRLEVAGLLLDRGANLEAKRNDGSTPLHRASEYGKLEVAGLLLDRGANLQAKDNDGDTPLHRASANGRREVAGLLLDRGAKLEATNKHGKTPLDYANGEVATLLKEYPKKKAAPAVPAAPAAAAAAAAPAVQPKAEEELPPEIAGLLVKLNLSKYTAKAAKWAEDTGAYEEIEVFNNWKDFADALTLKQIERQRLEKAAAQATTCPAPPGQPLPPGMGPPMPGQAIMTSSSAVMAKLQLHHVLALRLYTTSSFAKVNDPLRTDPPPRPHPFAATTYYIDEGIKLLRAVAASSPAAHQSKVYWRGMKDIGLSMQFMTEGGTEFGCLSTSASSEVAASFAASALPLVFKFETQDFTSRGADVAFLSVYEKEEEALYPPLTYLRPKKIQKETLHGAEVLVATIEPVFM